MTAHWPSLENCLAMATSSLKQGQRSAQENINDWDPAEKITPQVTQEEFRDFLTGYRIPKDRIASLLSSSHARRDFLAKNDTMKIRELAQYISEWKDIKQLMLQASQPKNGDQDWIMPMLAAVLSYEASIAQVPQYTLLNQIYSVNINGRTPVVYGWEKMSYFEAQKRQLSSIVEDNMWLLKEECEKAIAKQRKKKK